jgi:hypothetical protein
MVPTAVEYEQRQQYGEAYVCRSDCAFAGYNVSILEERLASRNQYPGCLSRLFKSGLKRGLMKLWVSVYCVWNMIHCTVDVHRKNISNSQISTPEEHSHCWLFHCLGLYSLTFDFAFPRMPCTYTDSSATKPDPHDRPIKLWVLMKAWACGSLKLTKKSVKFDLSACGDL